jgi:hypothetical protein
MNDYELESQFETHQELFFKQLDDDGLPLNPKERSDYDHDQYTLDLEDSQ